MANTRLDSDDRRKAIVDAAVPLFARKGFAGTTTRELAAAAGVSEALLFRHFPSKQSLYREILTLGCEGDPALHKLATLPACTETAIGIVRFMVRRFVLGGEAERGEMDLKMRLMLHSILEDGDYARELFSAITPHVVPLFAASMKAAEAAGDLHLVAGNHANRFWFAHHVAAMMAFAFLPREGIVPYEGAVDQLVDDASDFILRGIGMREAVIATSRAAPPLQLAAD
ncbi:MAG TPA: helix-turn-helix domain-containing protein [Stellaceae bacterium]|jgi:AcrR family transcriptional regulator|nr:helix-turn-helix domain-containing protein [Stellaceae bacterium]